MDKITKITIILLIFGLVIGLAIDGKASIESPESAHNVYWHDEQSDNAENNEELILNEISTGTSEKTGVEGNELY